MNENLLRNFAAPDRPEVGPGQYRCEMCNGVFDFGWTNDEARDEAVIKGVDPDKGGIVCDDCYRLTPYGADPERG